MDRGRGTEGHLGAEIVYPGLAVGAGPAGHTRLYGHPVPRHNIGHPIAHTRDHASSLNGDMERVMMGSHQEVLPRARAPWGP